MKKIFKTIVLNLIALKIAELFLGCLTFSTGFRTLLITALALTGFEYILKPLAKLLFLPINLITLGTLRWIINVIGLYLVTHLVQGFTISSYHFPGINWQGIIIPETRFSLILTYITVSLILNFIITIFRWLF